MENADKDKVERYKLDRYITDAFWASSGYNLRFCTATWTLLYELSIQRHHTDERIYAA